MERVENCSYDEFLNSYLLANKPCILSSSFTANWPCRRKWTLLPGVPNWQFLQQTYGVQTVTVADCATRDFSDQKREEMLLSQAIERLQIARDGRLDIPYIKDWHLVRHSSDLSDPEDRSPYDVPNLFQDDWLNNVPPDRDDFRFCYAGVESSFTPLHRDVYTSYSWSTNVVGRKIWHFFPPQVAHHLRRDPSYRRSEIVFDIRDVDEKTFPSWPEAKKHEIVIIQEPGETIFVPSGWYHQVINLTDCISLNQNWCNSVNLPSLYSSMKEATEDVEAAIADVRSMLIQVHATSLDSADQTTPQDDWRVEWHRQVNTLLKLDAGWGWEDFFRMISRNIDNETMAASLELRPTRSFTLDRVRAIIDDFGPRPKDPRSIANPMYTHLPEVREAVEEVLSKMVGLDAQE
ncbi:Clavaminate synthase-like protein [Clavulina sp. PMI_390]|nr:Clavaminate synthase-like protein [Clavulina sp. PMI_390]